MATAFSGLTVSRIRTWVRDLGTQGAFANARTELDRRAHEHALLDQLERRVPRDVSTGAEAA